MGMFNKMLFAYFLRSKQAKIGMAATAIVIIILAILIPSVTLRAAPDTPSETDQDLVNPLIAFQIKQDVMARVEELLHEIPLIDTHNDLPFQYYLKAGNHFDLLDISQDLSNMTHTDIPRLRKGHVGGQFFVAYSRCETQYKDAVEFGMMQVDTIKRIVESYHQDFEFVRSADEFVQAHKRGKIGVSIGLEGGHMINSNMALLRMYYELGVRYMTLTHNCHTPWADAAYADKADPDTAHDDKVLEVAHGGLNSFGKDIVREMNRIGMMVDISHVSEKVMLDALETSVAPVIFSHSSAYEPCHHRRNVKDHVLRRLKKNGGVLMINFWSRVLVCTPNYKEANLTDVVNQINYVRDLIGVDFIGIGADYDGVSETPVGLEDVSTYPRLLAKLLEDPKWSEADIRKVAGENILRVMRDVERVKKEWHAKKPNDQMLDFNEMALKETNCSCRTISDASKEQDSN